MKTTITTIAMLAMLATAFTSCKKDKKDEPAPAAPAPPVNEGELITTMKVTLTDTLTNVSATYVFSDLDGPGGNPAIFGNGSANADVITILSGHIYKASILLLDETKSPVDTISNEVEEEGADHMFFFNSIAPTGAPYSVNLSGGTTIKYLDSDANNRGIGLETLWTANPTSTAIEPLKIELKHQPGVKDGTYAPGETDIQVDFKLIVN
jgi:hypothetical protein